MKRAVIILLSLVSVGCGYERFYDAPAYAEPPEANATLASLRAMATGETVTEDIVVRGVITSTDITGNFYRTFTIESDNAAIEVKAGLYDIYNNYPIGLNVALKLKGLALGVEYGIVQVGIKSPPGSAYTTDYIAYRPLIEQHLIRGMRGSEPQPRTVTIDEIDHNMCGLLLRVDDLRYTGNESDTWSQADYNTNRVLRDPENRRIAVYTSRFASFAGEQIPNGLFSVTGILEYTTVSGSTIFALKPRTADDFSKH